MNMQIQKTIGVMVMTTNLGFVATAFCQDHRKTNQTTVTEDKKDIDLALQELTEVNQEVIQQGLISVGSENNQLLIEIKAPITAFKRRFQLLGSIAVALIHYPNLHVRITLIHRAQIEPLGDHFAKDERILKNATKPCETKYIIFLYEYFVLKRQIDSSRIEVQMNCILLPAKTSRASGPLGN